MNNRKDDLDPLPYSDDIPCLMSSWRRVHIHTMVAKFLSDNKITGDYFEFGVGKGRSAVSAIRVYKRNNICNHYFLFDSFCGLPPLLGIDKNSIQFHEGYYAFSQQFVLEFLKPYSINLDHSIHLIPGWFEKSLSDWFSQFCGVKAAVVHVDVDHLSGRQYPIFCCDSRKSNVLSFDSNKVKSRFHLPVIILALLLCGVPILIGLLAIWQYAGYSHLPCLGVCLAVIALPPDIYK